MSAEYCTVNIAVTERKAGWRRGLALTMRDSLAVGHLSDMETAENGAERSGARGIAECGPTATRRARLPALPGLHFPTRTRCMLHVVKTWLRKSALQLLLIFWHEPERRGLPD